MTTPLLALDQVRCAVAGAVLLDHVTLRTAGDRVGLAGKTAGVRALLTGEATLVSGSVLVLGQTLSEARQANTFGCAVALGKVPNRWSVHRVLELAAEVSGRSPREANARARTVAELIGEPSILKCRWSRATVVEQFLAALALGLIADPALLFVRLPLGVLSPVECERYSAALARATQDRKLLAEVDRLPQHPCEHDWVESLNGTAYVFDGRDTAIGDAVKPNRARYLLRVVGNSGDVEAALQQAGTRPRPIYAPSDRARGRCGFLVDVDRSADGTADTGAVLDVCVARDLPVIELLPV
jgi:predicted ABC-type transport system involved in lysophospholipase L1 biosynthesis ATPase subunit